MLQKKFKFQGISSCFSQLCPFWTELTLVHLFMYASKTKKATEPNPTKFCLLPESTQSMLSVWVAYLGEGVQCGGKIPILSVNVYCIVPRSNMQYYKSSLRVDNSILYYQRYLHLVWKEFRVPTICNMMGLLPLGPILSINR